jgi:hypothetical protein
VSENTLSMVWKLICDSFETDVFDNLEESEAPVHKTLNLVTIGLRNESTKYETLTQVDGEWYSIYNRLKNVGKIHELTEVCKEDGMYPNLLVYEIMDNKVDAAKVDDQAMQFKEEEKEDGPEPIINLAPEPVVAPQSVVEQKPIPVPAPAPIVHPKPAHEPGIKVYI